ncbi:HD-GYP domain-containing protein [Natroniella acetigena]|uniref:HD-GYP domain-containing protein n=1 Tax=Natroniella acetigena TaxID=52004 RepID=UPI00200B2533|nr:HD-GYP domain-containing protein [Natroniella acetigena]MCK8828302.1 HD-GYP domain-containing protein [Natroniella acetigena]
MNILAKISEIKEADILGKTIYTADGNILLNEGVKLTKKNISKLKSLNIKNVYIKKENLNRKVFHVKEIVPEEVKKEIITCAKSYLNQAGSETDKVDDSDRKQILDLIDNVINLITKDDKLFSSLKDVRKLEDELFFHSTNVTILSLLIGKRMDYSDKQLKELGIGAFLHDIGKAKIPAKILHKPGKLTDKEFEEIKKHTTYGYKILKEHEEVPDVSAEIAYQHHERCDGSGYPRGLSAAYIRDYAKIVSIVDVFDSMINDRVYREGIKIPEVIEHLYVSISEKKVHRKIASVFLEIITPYPIGSIVELSIGHKAVVTKVNENNKLRPIVTVLDLIGLDKSLQIDLSKKTNIMITNVH